MNNYKAPGVYVEEVLSLPPSVAPVATAIPIFVGYTAKQPPGNEPTQIDGFLEFTQIFGLGKDVAVTEIHLTDTRQFSRAVLAYTHHLQASLRLFYANGGGRCFVKSLGAPAADDDLQGISDDDVTTALLDELATYDAPTIVVFPDHAGSTAYDDILQHCAATGDRVAILDTKNDDLLGADLRDQTGTDGLSYGAAYTPWLRVALPKSLRAHHFDGAQIFVGADAGAVDFRTGIDDVDGSLVDAAVDTADSTDRTEAEAQLRNTSAIYANVLRGLDTTPADLPPSGAVAGVYASVDASRGVWKAPANVSLNGVLAPTNRFTKDDLAGLNAPTGGKAINAIRTFSGKGTLVFGARTLDANNGEYKYISVRRLMNMIEESCAKAAEQFVFEPNDANTWVRVQGMIENFLELIWRDGGLQGATTREAFRVRIGLNLSMSTQDIKDGLMVVNVSVAPVRPAEFIVLRFTQHLITA
ncbi:phage tail sheath family protein [Neolewinella antarctica]|uniref:Tail sheath protein C-terminal domain-containing protein n=1 Tax=Neolewinella antarctica TaxID=442734 RepID=A0ABX0X6P1_9BACT|nr:phage tail sheath C-terminal domain-containing protein [Neolewinella antarctica]NJC24674.1 hypothetical protein [Neolewinella antarctica]